MDSLPRRGLRRTNDTMRPKHIWMGLALAAMVHGRAAAQLVFEPKSHDFGTILEADGPVGYTFTGKNRGDKPVVIYTITTSCGCTVPSYTREPIPPGGRTEVRVTFDPANRGGSFEKELVIYTTERRKAATLTIRGDVTPRERTVEERFPFAAAGGVRLSQTQFAMGYLYAGVLKQTAIEVLNTSKHPVQLELRMRDSSGLLRLSYPRTLRPGKQGTIRIGCCNPSDAPRYGTQSDVIEVWVDGRCDETLLMGHAIALGARVTEHPPKAELSRRSMAFGVIHPGEEEPKQRLTLYNKGTGPLTLFAAEHDPWVAARIVRGTERLPLDGATLAAGGEAEIEVTLLPGKADYGMMVSTLKLFTNDPDRPMRDLHITATVEARRAERKHK